MILLAIAAQLMAVAVAAPRAAQTDPLAPARTGQLQCYTPNLAAKTCQSIAGYVFAPDGTIDNVTEALLAPQGPVTMRVHSPVVVQGDGICGPMRAADLDKAQILMAGTPVPEAKAGPVRAQLKTAFQTLLGSQICTFVHGASGVLQTTATVNGKPRPDMDQAMIWVTPSQGYRVGP